MFLFTLLVSWILCLYVAFALMLLPFTRTSVPSALRLSGSSLFTLGFATPAGAAPYGIVFAASISGLVVIALMIGYMPTIYSAYNRRETLVIMLEALDAAALQLSLCPSSAPAEARPLLRVGYITMRSLARSLGLPSAEDPHPDDPLTLTREDFDLAVRHLDEAGWVFDRKPDEAWMHFRGWRVNYELAAHSIAAHLDLAPALWSGPRTRLGEVPRMPDRPAHRTPQGGPVASQ
jgi:hypothetical protein